MFFVVAIIVRYGSIPIMQKKMKKVEIPVTLENTTLYITIWD
jgi:hypothetical protein